MNNKNNLTARAAYDKARELLYKAMRSDKAFKTNQDCWDWVNSRKFSQGEVRLEVELNTTSTVFQFGLTENQANSTNVLFNTENRLRMQDTLFANEYGIYVGQPASRTDTGWMLRTYGNTQDFAAADAAAIDETFYSHGRLRMTCNNDVISPYRRLWNNYYRPETQMTAALGAGSPGDQICGAEDGMITAEPYYILVGSKGYIPEIVLPAALASAAAFERAIIVYSGVLAQNSTNVS